MLGRTSFPTRVKGRIFLKPLEIQNETGLIDLTKIEEKLAQKMTFFKTAKKCHICHFFIKQNSPLALRTHCRAALKTPEKVTP